MIYDTQLKTVLTLSSRITGSTPKKGLAGNSGLRGESSGAGLGESRIPPVSAMVRKKWTVTLKS